MTDKKDMGFSRSETAQENNDPANQRQWIQDQIRAIVGESIQDIRQQLAQLAQEQQRLTQALNKLSGGQHPPMEPLAPSESRSESELDIWIDNDEGADSPHAPEPGREETAPWEDFPEQPEEEELPLDFSEEELPAYGNQNRRPSEKSVPEDPPIGLEEEVFGDPHESAGSMETLPPIGEFISKVPGQAAENLSEQTDDGSATGGSAETENPFDFSSQPADDDPGSVTEQRIYEIEELLETDEDSVGKSPETNGRKSDEAVPDTTDRFSSPYDDPSEDRFEPKSGSRLLVWILVLVAIAILAIWAGKFLLSPKPASVAEPSAVTSPVANPDPQPQSEAAPAPKPQKAEEAAASSETDAATTPKPPPPETMAQGPGPSSQPEADIASGPKERDATVPEPEPETTEAATEISETGTALEPTRYPFSIFLASFKTMEQARRAVAAYRQNNLFAYWTEVDLGDRGVWYRVFGGYFQTESAARKTIEENNLSDALVRQTRWTARIGTYDQATATAMESRMAEEVPCDPYRIDADQEMLHLYVGAFLTESGAKKQCDKIIQKGLDCEVAQR